MIKTVIIEDDEISLNVLKRMIILNVPEIEILGEANNVRNAILMIKEKKPDLVFLDIQLSDGTAFNILDSFKHQTFKIIFVTSHASGALKAIKLSALDYLLKPVSKKDLVGAIEKYKNNVQSSDKLVLQQKVFKENLYNENKNSTKVILTTSQEYFIVESNDIVRCQSDSYYTNFFLNNGEKIFVSKTMKEYESLLTDFGFVRVHNSHLVNIDYIKSFTRKEGDYLIMKDGSRVPVSRRKKSVIMNVLFGSKALTE